MTDISNIIAFLPSRSAPNLLATARAAAVLARSSGHTSVAIVMADNDAQEIAQSGIDRVVAIEGLSAETTYGETLAAAFMAAAEATGLDLRQALILLPFGAVE